jgi:hypothetical protein
MEPIQTILNNALPMLNKGVTLPSFNAFSYLHLILDERLQFAADTSFHESQRDSTTTSTGSH